MSVTDTNPEAIGLAEATPGDATAIAKLLDLERDSVWQIIHGMKYRNLCDLAIAVHVALLGDTSGPATPQAAGVPSPLHPQKR